MGSDPPLNNPLRKRIAHEIDLGGRHRGVQGQGEFVFAYVLALRRRAHSVLIRGKALDGGVVDRGLDAVLFHGFDEGRPVHASVQEDGHDVIGGRSAVVVAEGDAQVFRHGVEAREIPGHERRSRGVGLGQFGELHEAERGAHFVDAVIEAGFKHVVGRGAAFHAVEAGHGHAVRAQVLAFHEQRFAAGGDHAAFAHGEVFVGKEAPGRDIAEGAQLAAPVGSAVGVRAVFDEGEFVPPADVDDRVHVAGIPRIVDDHDGLCFRRNLALDVDGVHGPVFERGHVAKHYLAARHAHGIQVRDKGERGHDYFVARPYAAGEHRDMQGRGPVRHREAFRAFAQLGGIGFLKIERPLAHGDPARFESIHDGIVFALVIVEFEELDFPLHNTGHISFLIAQGRRPSSVASKMTSLFLSTNSSTRSGFFVSVGRLTTWAAANTALG